MIPAAPVASWLGTRCDNYILTADDGEEWKITTKLRDRLCVDPFWIYDIREVVGVYLCTPVEAPESGRQTIAKIWMQ